MKLLFLSRFDTDRSGNISSNELSNAFKNFGYNLYVSFMCFHANTLIIYILAYLTRSINFVHTCMRTYDRRGIGHINFDDFIQCCVLLKTLTDKFKEKDSQQNGSIRIHYEDVSDFVKVEQKFLVILLSGSPKLLSLIQRRYLNE